jgi:hypothetical protein
MMLSLILIMLRLGLGKLLLGMSAPLLQTPQLLIQLRHLGLRLGHETIILAHLLLQGLENTARDAGTLKTADGGLGDELLGGVGDLLLLLCAVLRRTVG